MENNTKISYIYALSSSEFPEETRYIGVSDTPESRLTDHLKERHQESKTHKQKWIKSVINNGFKIQMEIVRCIPFKYKYIEEENTIRLYKSLGARLVNGNNGGLGNKGLSEDGRERLRQAKLGNTWNKGRKFPKEFGEAISKRNKGLKKSPEHITKILATKKLKGFRRSAPRKYEDKLIDIFSLFNSGYTIKKISEKLEINKSAVSNILYNNQYSDKKKELNLSINGNRIKD